MKIDPNKVYPLKGKVQHYAWGGDEFIPALLGVDNPDHQPFAEYWMGAHVLAPSLVEGQETAVQLDQLLKAQPALLGKQVQAQYGQLPFLLKILDVKQMLSIQVHPTREGAETGFDAEEESGIAIDAPHRNYKDRNHKPEVMIALSDFYLLHGFKPGAELRKTLSGIPEFRELQPVFDREGYKGLYSHVMGMSQQAVNQLLYSLVRKEVRRRSFHESEPDEAGYWVGEYYLHKNPGDIDRGIFSIYFLNLVQLSTGEGIFQAAGVPHAYLRGQNVELMANSDNVLRGGLTHKHVDVDELLKHTRFEAVEPEILNGNEDGAFRDFRFPVDDFAISELVLSGTQQAKLRAGSAEILICMEGQAVLSAANEVRLGKGDACVVFAGNHYIAGAEQSCQLFRAYVP